MSLGRPPPSQKKDGESIVLLVAGAVRGVVTSSGLEGALALLGLALGSLATKALGHLLADLAVLKEEANVLAACQCPLPEGLGHDLVGRHHGARGGPVPDEAGLGLERRAQVDPDADVGIAGGGPAAVGGNGRKGDVGGAGGPLDAVRGQDVRVRLVRGLIDDVLGEVLGVGREGLALDDDGRHGDAVPPLVRVADLERGGVAGVGAGLLPELEAGLVGVGADALEV